MTSISSLIADLPLIADLLVGAGAGALLGQAIAYRHERQSGQIRESWIVWRWTQVGVVAALLAHLLAALR